MVEVAGEVSCPTFTTEGMVTLAALDLIYPSNIRNSVFGDLAFCSGLGSTDDFKMLHRSSSG